MAMVIDTGCEGAGGWEIFSLAPLLPRSLLFAQNYSSPTLPMCQRLFGLTNIKKSALTMSERINRNKSFYKPGASIRPIRLFVGSTIQTTPVRSIAKFSITTPASESS